MNDYKPIDVTTAINLLPMLFVKPYIIPGDTETAQRLGQYNVTVEADEDYDRLSQFGTPVIGSFWAVPDDLPYKVWSIQDKLVDKQFDKFEFPIATVVEFMRQKNIVKSATIGGKGTVKEIMGLGDWEITIRGLLVNDESRTAQKTANQQQYALDKLNDIAGAIKVEGKIFYRRDISHIVIESVNFSPVQGKPGLVQYEVKAYSDESFLLIGL